MNARVECPFCGKPVEPGEKVAFRRYGEPHAEVAQFHFDCVAVEFKPSQDIGWGADGNMITLPIPRVVPDAEPDA